MEVVFLSICTGVIIGGVAGYFAAISHHSNHPEEFAGPKDWMERHRNLSMALIQLRRSTEIKEDTVYFRQQNLQLQMNPHFIFNALTGINMLLLREDGENALKSIRKFRGLLIKSWGNALENPKGVSTSTLVEEIAFLSDYVALEQMRISSKVDFSIDIDAALEDDYPVPTFLIQPLIENALWHGIDDSDGNSIELKLTADQDSETLTIAVIDNGKGLKEVKGERKSFGLNILKERLMLISDQSSLIIENRSDARGCQATITIPLAKR